MLRVLEWVFSAIGSLRTWGRSRRDDKVAAVEYRAQRTALRFERKRILRKHDEREREILRESGDKHRAMQADFYRRGLANSGIKDAELAKLDAETSEHLKSLRAETDEQVRLVDAKIKALKEKERLLG